MYAQGEHLIAMHKKHTCRRSADGQSKGEKYGGVHLEQVLDILQAVQLYRYVRNVKKMRNLLKFLK